MRRGGAGRCRLQTAFFTVEADTVIIAVSQSPNPLLPASEPRLELAKGGRLVVNADTGETTLPGVFAGGDIANDAGTVIAAMGDAKRAARRDAGIFDAGVVRRTGPKLVRHVARLARA